MSLLDQLTSPEARRPFAALDLSAVPSAPGVYAIWDSDDRYVYAGMSGRSATRVEALANREKRRWALSQRIASHASGRRSGDQFCVYVADRLVLPQLDAEARAAIASGSVSFDHLVRDYVHGHLSVAWAVTETGEDAFALEALARVDLPGYGPPLLNPALS